MSVSQRGNGLRCACWAPVLILLFVGHALLAQEKNRVGNEKVSVQAKLSQDKVHAGTTCAAMLIVSIADGWHINSAAPADEALIGTSVEIEKTNVLDSASVFFPSGIEREFGYAEVPIEVLEGRVSISLTLHVSKNVMPGKYSIPIRVEYQACSERVCLAPATVVADLPLHVVPLSEPIRRISHETFEDARARKK